MSSHGRNVVDGISQLLADDAQLVADIQGVIERDPSLEDLFLRIIHHCDPESPRKNKRVKTEEPDGKQTASSRATTNIKTSTSKAEELLIIKEVSFVTPLRKKLNLVITSLGIRAVSPSDSSKIELEVIYKDISQVALLPVPEKAAKLFNFCLFRHSKEESVVFTVPDSEPKNASGAVVPKSEPDVMATYSSLISSVLEKQLHKLRVATPSTQDFVSALPQPHRRQEPAVHITAHRGSKEGYLFFLSAGLIYGFKRPLLFVPVSDITSITYNDILQRTFNLTVSSIEGDYEFSMIDIAEYDRVDKYVKKYKLNDASLSESRRAQTKKEPIASEISKAADEIAGTITGGTTSAGGANDEDDDDEEEADENFEDDKSHGGSTVGTDESDSEQESVTGDEDIGSNDTEEES